VKPVLCYSYTRPSPLACATLAGAGLLVNLNLTWTARALRALVERGRFKPRHTSTAALPDSPAQIAVRLRAARDPLCEYEARALLAMAGLPADAGRLVTSRAGLHKAGAAAGWPLALKIQSPDIPHKTEVGGVTLGIAGPAALDAAYDAMLAEVRRHRPGARIHGVLVQVMAPPGVEMIVSTINDVVFGPVIMVGAGGINTEIFGDLSHRLAPVDPAEALDMLADLRSLPLLQGWRGAAPADVTALAGLVADVSSFAARHRATVQEIELNPVLVHPAGQGCTIADALLLPVPPHARTQA